MVIDKFNQPNDPMSAKWVRQIRGSIEPFAQKTNKQKRCVFKAHFLLLF